MDNIIKVTSDQAKAVEEYAIYKKYTKTFYYHKSQRIVGDDDKGRTFSPAEFEAYKRRVFPMVTSVRVHNAT